MMKNRSLLLIACMLLLFSCCEYTSDGKKEELDSLVSNHWDNWKTEGKDTTLCIVDFAEIIPLDWDTMIYVDYYSSNKNDELIEYMNNQYWREKENLRGCPEESIHFWKNGKLVYRIPLLMASDDEKGVFFCTKSFFIKRGYNESKFRVQKDTKFFAIRDITENAVHINSFGINW